MREAVSDVWSIPHERMATKQTARQAAARPGFDAQLANEGPSTSLLALRICVGYSTRLASCIRGHLVRNAAHEGFRIRPLEREAVELGRQPARRERVRACGLGAPFDRVPQFEFVALTDEHHVVIERG